MNEEIRSHLDGDSPTCVHQKFEAVLYIYLKYDSTCVALGVHLYCTHEQFIAFALVVL